MLLREDSQVRARGWHTAHDFVATDAGKHDAISLRRHTHPDLRQECGHRSRELAQSGREEIRAVVQARGFVPDVARRRSRASRCDPAFLQLS